MAIIPHEIGWSEKEILLYEIGCSVSGVASSPYNKAQIQNCISDSNTNGIGFLINGSYVAAVNCSAGANTTGWKLTGGNFSLDGCSGSGNSGDGLWIAAGSGNGHGTVTGGQWNHNNRLLNYDDVDETGSDPLSVNFVSMSMFGGAILINDDLPIFSGCLISVTTITVQGGCTRALFIGCRIHGTPTVNGAQSANATFTSCYKNDGSLYP